MGKEGEGRGQEAKSFEKQKEGRKTRVERKGICMK